MAGTSTDRRSMLRARRFVTACMTAACVMIGSLALAASALAGPATGQYKLHYLSGGKGGGNGGSGKIGGSGGDIGLPVLILGGAVVASGGAAFAYIRWRRRSGLPT